MSSVTPTAYARAAGCRAAASSTRARPRTGAPRDAGGDAYGAALDDRRVRWFCATPALLRGVADAVERERNGRLRRRGAARGGYGRLNPAARPPPCSNAPLLPRVASADRWKRRRSGLAAEVRRTDELSRPVVPRSRGSFCHALFAGPRRRAWSDGCVVASGCQGSDPQWGEVHPGGVVLGRDAPVVVGVVAAEQHFVAAGRNHREQRDDWRVDVREGQRRFRVWADAQVVAPPICRAARPVTASPAWR